MNDKYIIECGGQVVRLGKDATGNEAIDEAQRLAEDYRQPATVYQATVIVALSPEQCTVALPSEDPSNG